MAEATALQSADLAAETMLRYENVSHFFTSEAGRQVEALRAIRLSVPAHRFITLVGASGSGKTTLLNMAAGLLNPASGILRYQPGLDLKTDLAYVFQHYTLLPWRTVLENITFGLELRGIRRSERLAAGGEWIHRVGLEGFEHAYPHELSGGMRQRAAIAMALAIRPKLLLMDEPFGSLDDSIRSDLQRMLVTLQTESKTTILFVTHNIDEAIILADRIIVLSRAPGRVLDEIEVLPEINRNRSDRQFTDLFLRIRNLIQ